MCNIPVQYLINDQITELEMKDNTFSNYKKREVISSFEKTIVNDNIESACYWGLNY